MAGLLPLALGARSKRPIQILGVAPSSFIGKILHPSILVCQAVPGSNSSRMQPPAHLIPSLLAHWHRSNHGQATNVNKSPKYKGLAVPLCPRGIGPVHEARQYGHACLDQRRGELKAQACRVSHGYFEMIMMAINYCASHTSLSGFWLNPLHVNEWIKPMGVPDYCHGGLCVQAIVLLLAPIGPS